MNKSIAIIGMLVLISGVSGCSNLASVRTFAKDTEALSSSVNQLANETGASCTRRLTNDVAIRGLTGTQRESAMTVCDDLKKSGALINTVNLILTEYAKALADLSDDKLVTYSAQLDGAKSTLAALKDSGNQPYIEKAKLDGSFSLIDIVLKASTDAYRQREIRKLLERHAEVKQVAEFLQIFIKRGYLGTIQNEAENIESIQFDLKTEFLKREPIRAREKIEELEQTRQKLVERQKAATEAINGLSAMVKTHEELLKYAEHLDAKELIAATKEYGQQVYKVQKQLQAAF